MDLSPGGDLTDHAEPTLEARVGLDGEEGEESSPEVGLARQLATRESIGGASGSVRSPGSSNG